MLKKLFQPQVNALDFFQITIFFFPWYLFQQQRKPMGKGLWVASTRASPEEIKKSLSHSTQHLPAHTWDTVFRFAPCYAKNMLTVWRGSREESQRLPKDQEACSMKRAERAGCVQPGQSRAWWRTFLQIPVFKGGYKEVGDSLFIRSHMENMRVNGYKVLLGKFQLETKGKFFTMRITRHWNNLPREVVDSPALARCKIQLGRVLGHLV